MGMKVMSCCAIFLLQAAQPQKKEDKERQEEVAKNCDAAEQALMDLYEVVMQDFMIDPDLRLVVFLCPTSQSHFLKPKPKKNLLFSYPLGKQKDVATLFLESEGVS
jgi:hypothetical protein